MIIPWQQLTEQALQGLLEEFASRDGTDYGEVEVPLTAKVEQALQQLKRGEIVIVFDAVMESASLMTRQEAEALNSQQHSAEESWYDDV